MVYRLFTYIFYDMLHAHLSSGKCPQFPLEKLKIKLLGLMLIEDVFKWVLLLFLFCNSAHKISNFKFMVYDLLTNFSELNFIHFVADIYIHFDKVKVNTSKQNNNILYRSLCLYCLYRFLKSNLYNLTIITLS